MFQNSPKAAEESYAFGMSMRGWLALLLTFSVCLLSVMGQEVNEPLYGLAYMAIGFYFGQSKKNVEVKPTEEGK